MDKFICATMAIFAALLLVIFSKPSLYYPLFSRQATIDPANLQTTYDASQTVAVFENKMLKTPLYTEQDSTQTVILGDTTVPKRIEIDLTNQRLYGFEGNKKIYDFLVSTGKWGLTPTGTFRIWTKLRYTTMRGGSKELGTYYNLPNVAYTMYFYNQEYPTTKGYGIHTAYWHNNFGTPMSHGCINMREQDAKALYYWANPQLGEQKSIRASGDNPGTPVVIYGQTPKS